VNIQCHSQKPAALRVFKRGLSLLNLSVIIGGLPAVFICALAFAFSLAANAQTAKKEAYFVEPSILSLPSLVLPPPVAGSPIAQAELSLLHQIENSRTKAEIAAAQADDADQTIFIFRTILGPAFTSEQLPLTAALSADVHAEEPLASDALKELYARPRPYQADKTLHPVCKLTQTPNSYPSGHTLSGYMLAFTLAEMLPEKRQEIFTRVDDYAHNRLVCGVHYPSDIEASRRIAYLMFGAMMATPRFNADLSAARTELRSHLGLSTISK
jgi:acid phosphatase (class A)